MKRMNSVPCSLLVLPCLAVMAFGVVELSVAAEPAVVPAAAVAAPAALNILSKEEAAAGWKLLFNGTDLSGWHNFKKDTVQPGW